MQLASMFVCCIVKPRSTQGQKLCNILHSPMKLLVLNTKTIPDMLQQSMLRFYAWWTRQCRLLKVKPEALLYSAPSHRQVSWSHHVDESVAVMAVCLAETILLLGPWGGQPTRMGLLVW